MPSSLATTRDLSRFIHNFRNQKVILDSDLAHIYGVPTKRLNEQVKRNRHRFPPDFMFVLSPSEIEELNRSQIATGSQKHRDPRFPPYAFTEHGAIMAANVLNSKKAEEMSVFVVRAFIKMRSILSQHHELASELKELDKRLTQRLDLHETAIVDVLRRIMRLLDPPQCHHHHLNLKSDIVRLKNNSRLFYFSSLLSFRIRTLLGLFSAVLLVKRTFTHSVCTFPVHTDS